MRTFLEIVAEDIVKKWGTELSNIAVVFPNKRASLFLNEHLAKLAGKPVWSPAYVTISDLFRQHPSLLVGDPIKLICDLHKSFTTCTGIDETLDHFYGWGQLLLADFDDIDKNMADADKVFANLRDIHELDDVSYLTDEQKRILQRFFSNFSEDHNTALKRKFLELWSHFGDIYHDYQQRLRDQGLAYEGMLYRDVAENMQFSLHYDHYLFVGFNLLQKVEQKLFRRMKEEKKCSFYWDFDHYYIYKGTREDMLVGNEAGYFISEYLTLFPNELDNNDPKIYDNLNHDKPVTLISATTEDIQARYISTWLREDDRMAAGRKTAVVMCDETILQTAIHCLPEEVKQVNVTTGYPLQHALISSFVMQVLNYLIYGGRRAYRRMSHHPYYTYVEHDEDIIPKNTHDLSLADINRSLTTLVRTIAQQTAEKNDAFEQESLFRTYTLLNRLENLIASGDLTADTITLQKLIQQLIASTSIPFHGEPIVGIQLMGVLETRNLDFDHLLILSCNEGNMPKGVNDASFIPYAIRKAYGLTTIDHKVAVYAYYFHRLLQRAQDVTILYNNSTEDGHTGEMSRFMLQLMVESNLKIVRKSLQAGQELLPIIPRKIEKDPTVMEALSALARKGMYPTFINRYLRCQLQFYYNHIMGIQEPDSLDEDVIDNRTFGNIFHKASQLLYEKYMEKSRIIMPGDIEYIEKHPEVIERAVDQAFQEEVFKTEQLSREEMEERLNGLHLINREVIIQYLKRLLKIDKLLAPFYVIGLEKKVEDVKEVSTTAGVLRIRMGGIIDRLDLVRDKATGKERIRVVDYKTSSRALTAKIYSVEEIFEQPIIPKKHADYYLQTLFYSLFVRHHPQLNSSNLPVSPALLFIQHTAGDNYDPTLWMGREKMMDILPYEEAFNAHLDQVLTEIFEPTHPFLPTDDRSLCASCPYRELCGL